MSTYSPLKIELIGTGEQDGTWGTTTNTNLGTSLEEMITGSADITFASTTYTLSLTNTNASQLGRNLRLNLGGTSGGPQDLVLPAGVEKLYLINNGTADTITCKNAGGTTVAVATLTTQFIYNDGTHVTAVSSTVDPAMGGDLSGTTSNAQIVAGAVGATELATDAVTTVKILDANVTAAKLATDAVTTVKILDANVTAAKLATDAVTTVKILDANVTAAKLASDAVTTVKILDANVTTAKMADDSVNATKLNVTGDGTSGQALTSDADGSMTWVTVQAYDADTAKTDVVQTFTTAQRGAITALVDGATITPDMDDTNNFSVTLGGNRTLANPTNITVGQVGSIFVSQDGTGSRTLAYGSYWDFIAATAPVLTTTASAVDRIDYIVRTATSIQAVVTLAYS